MNSAGRTSSAPNWLVNRLLIQSSGCREKEKPVSQRIYEIPPYSATGPWGVAFPPGPIRPRTRWPDETIHNGLPGTRPQCQEHVVPETFVQGTKVSKDVHDGSGHPTPRSPVMKDSGSDRCEVKTSGDNFPWIKVTNSENEASDDLTCQLCKQDKVNNTSCKQTTKRIMVRVVVPQGEPDGDPHSRGASEINDEDLGIYDDIDDGSSLTGQESDREQDVVDNETKSEATTTRTESAIKRNVISVRIKDRDDGEEGDMVDELREIDTHPPPQKRSGILKKDSEDSEAHPEMQSLMFSNVDTNEHNMSASDIYATSPGVRGKANTPASTYTEWTELRDLDSRLAHDTTRDSMYKKAVNLMSMRCATSNQNRSGPTPLLCASNPPFGSPFPKYFYVHQEKPTPMPPLKAWRGYNGNVYFEPIVVNQAKVEDPPELPQPRVHSETLSRLLASRHSSQSYRTNLSKSASSQLLKYRKMAILDKHSVVDQTNPNLNEDITWIRGQESVGSLRIEQVKKKRVTFSKDKIMRGSMARSMTAGGVGRTLLSVSGVKSASPPRTPATLLRSQTQYSQSPRRMTTNTPDNSSLPPLDELRLRLRHADSNKETVVHIIPPVDRLKYEGTHMKPYIKYSHSLKSGQGSVRSIRS